MATVLVEGKPVERGQEVNIAFIGATPHLRQTLGVALLRGRDLTDSEGATKSTVALINQTMAKRLWADEDPLGRRFRLDGEQIAGLVHRRRRPRGLPPLSRATATTRSRPRRTCRTRSGRR